MSGDVPEKFFKFENLLLSLRRAIQAYFTWPVKILTKLWNGRYSLPLAFWWFYFLWFISYLCLIFPLALPFLIAGVPAVRMMMPLAVVYIVAAAIGTWRSAEAYQGPPLWRDATKVAIVVLSCVHVVGFANGGFEKLLDIATAR